MMVNMSDKMDTSQYGNKTHKAGQELVLWHLCSVGCYDWLEASMSVAGPKTENCTVYS